MVVLENILLHLRIDWEHIIFRLYLMSPTSSHTIADSAFQTMPINQLQQYNHHVSPL